MARTKIATRKSLHQPHVEHEPQTPPTGAQPQEPLFHTCANDKRKCDNTVVEEGYWCSTCVWQAFHPKCRQPSFCSAQEDEECVCCFCVECNGTLVPSAGDVCPMCVYFQPKKRRLDDTMEDNSNTKKLKTVEVIVVAPSATKKDLMSVVMPKVQEWNAVAYNTVLPSEEQEEFEEEEVARGSIVSSQQQQPPPHH